MKVTAILGSPGSASRCAALLQLAQSHLAPLADECSEVTLCELPGASLLQARFGDPAIRAAIRQVMAADLVLIATPIHKAAYSGLLKSFLDLLPPQALRGKTVLPLATGSGEAQCLAVGHALRPVLRALGARDILDTVVASDAEIVALESGAYRIGDPPRWRLEQSLRALLDTARSHGAGRATAARATDALLARVRAAARASPRI